eukprot:m51a1_g9365 AMP deaminase, putative (1295) ;mRNA; f:176563-182012
MSSSLTRKQSSTGFVRLTKKPVTALTAIDTAAAAAALLSGGAGGSPPSSSPRTLPPRTPSPFQGPSVPRITSDHSRESKKACALLTEAMALRYKYFSALSPAEAQAGAGRMPLPPLPEPTQAAPSPSEYLRDYDRLIEICGNGPAITFCLLRLRVLEKKYKFHKLLNLMRELKAIRDDPTDSSNCVKVDTHVHLAAAMTEKHLLEFIKEKMRTSADEVVMVKEGKPMTLSEVFRSLGIDPTCFTVHMLGVRAGKSTFQRFDIFNDRYNPFGVSDLRTIFLKTNNYLKGKYMAELVKEVLEKNEGCEKKTEFRISIYGRYKSEWDELAEWIEQWGVKSTNNRWMIQVPRIYNHLRSSKMVNCFQDLLDNIFKPLFEVTENPDAHPALHNFLKDVSGFDSVDDESKTDIRIDRSMPTPDTWTDETNPPYFYYLYYMYANLVKLNKMRRDLKLNTFDFRPHSGESGSELHLVSAFLTSTGINHGINLEKSPVLQYLFYLAGIGICVSPLSNNSLFLNYSSNPFPYFFRRGLNVSLSTDDPLQFHYTQSPLVEEYAIASRFWKFTSVDIAEIARNSVKHSGFPDELKARWLGRSWKLPGVAGNDPGLTNVPNIRVAFRHQVFKDEYSLFATLLSSAPGSERALVVDDRVGLYSATTISGLILDPADESNTETFQALPAIVEALRLRSKYMERSFFPERAHVAFPDTVPRSKHAFAMFEGVMRLYSTAEALCSNDEEEVATIECVTCHKMFCADCFRVLHKHASMKDHFHTKREVSTPLYTPVPFAEFISDLHKMIAICSLGSVRTMCWNRNHLLQERFKFHLTMNEETEDESCKSSGTDFYRIVKVDTHIHNNRSMTSQQFLHYIQEKLQHERDTVVWKSFKGRSNVTFGQTFEMLGLGPNSLNLDSLSVLAGEETYMRFDAWLDKYNPFGKAELRDLLLKHSNDCNGRFLAELIRTCALQPTLDNPSLKIELRISVQGKDLGELDTISKWILQHNLKTPGNRWVLQVPRVYTKMRSSINSFGHLLLNIFLPLFEVTRDPATHPDLHEFLKDVSCFDMVGDELVEPSMYKNMPLPDAWTAEEMPPYAYWAYFLYANIQTLNYFRRARGLNVFDFRPHCGEMGDVFHLASTFLTAKHINCGLNLKENPVLAYLYYLSQIGVAMTPLSDSTIHVQYQQNPFSTFFRRGLNVSLGTDSPLHVHMTAEPLVEEYATAAQTYKLSVADLCELARNSVLQSGFRHDEKVAWIGENYWLSGPDGNDVSKTNVPGARLKFRADVFRDEMTFILQTESHGVTLNSVV